MLHRRQRAINGRDPNPHRRRHPKQPRASTDLNTREVPTGKTDRRNGSANAREKTSQYKRAVQAAKASQATLKKGTRKAGAPTRSTRNRAPRKHNTDREEAHPPKTHRLATIQLGTAGEGQWPLDGHAAGGRPSEALPN